MFVSNGQSCKNVKELHSKIAALPDNLHTETV